MINQHNYIAMSLELNLFFLRIMKEHSLFLQLGFMPIDGKMAGRAGEFVDCFEKLLSEATALACGNVSSEAIESKQFVTQYTLDAERLTKDYTGASINSNLTKKELALEPGNRHSPEIMRAVDELNRKAYQATAALAEFKDRLLCNVLACKTFTFNYPLLIKHILREARFFMRMLVALCERRSIIRPEDLINQEVFWNRQMAEHAKFIAGLLDPTEETLIDTARMFGKEFDKLTAEAKSATQRTFEIAESTNDSIAAMKRLRDFKATGTQGLLDCKIRSIIVPLLADHVLREANHYLCVLGVCNPQ